MIPKVFILAILSFLFINSNSQEADSLLSKFLAAQLGENVYLRWTISAGNTCEDTYVERSADGINYKRIGLIGGICGSPDQAITYGFTDTMPLANRDSYYRLELGNYGFTSPKTVNFIRYNADGFLLAPNPFKDMTRMAFENPDHEEITLILNDMNGRLAYKRISHENEFIISGAGLNAGVYIYRIFKNGTVIFSGKLIID